MTEITQDSSFEAAGVKNAELKAKRQAVYDLFNEIRDDLENEGYVTSAALDLLDSPDEITEELVSEIKRAVTEGALSEEVYRDLLQKLKDFIEYSAEHGNSEEDPYLLGSIKLFGLLTAS